MKRNAIRLITAFIMLIVIASLYRIIPGRPAGFAPQYAMAVFGGAVFMHHKKWAFLLPVGSLFISDLLFQLLYRAGLTVIPGFYSGQLVNYLLFAALTGVGFAMRKITVLRILLASVAAPTLYFLASNFWVWLTAGLYPKTTAGLMQCYAMGVPFYPNSVYATLVFSAILFGGYYWITKSKKTAVSAMA